MNASPTKYSWILIVSLLGGVSPMPSTLTPMEGEIHRFLFPFFCCFALS